MEVLYEDNHIIIVYKEAGEIVQGDKLVMNLCQRLSNNG